ncbi:MAG TPA: hypothetical protein VLL52_17355 [Anaerolineae bacterium]|nr:hypothetical protein [Anaerolineae bacterium]
MSKYIVWLVFGLSLWGVGCVGGGQNEVLETEPVTTVVPTVVLVATATEEVTEVFVEGGEGGWGTANGCLFFV